MPALQSLSALSERRCRRQRALAARRSEEYNAQLRGGLPQHRHCRPPAPAIGPAAGAASRLRAMEVRDGPQAEQPLDRIARLQMSP